MAGDSLQGPGGLSGVCLGCGAVSLKATPFLGQFHLEIGQVDMYKGWWFLPNTGQSAAIFKTTFLPH